MLVPSAHRRSVDVGATTINFVDSGSEILATVVKAAGLWIIESEAASGSIEGHKPVL